MPTGITWTCPFCIRMSSSRHWNIKRHINTLHPHLRGEPIDSVTGYTRAQIEAARKSLRPSYYYYDPNTPFRKYSSPRSYTSTSHSYSLSSSQENVVNENSSAFAETFWDTTYKAMIFKLFEYIKTDMARLMKQNEEIIALLRKITNNLVRS
jgi:hypothetical protein